jgi:hypothetical protein
MKIFVNRSQESLEKKFMGTHCNALIIYKRYWVGYLQKGLKPFYEILRKMRKTNKFLWSRFSWSDLRSNKIVNKNQDWGWMRDGLRCPKQVSLKSDLILPPTKFSKVYFFQRLSTSRIFLMDISWSNLIHVFQSS